MPELEAGVLMFEKIKQAVKEEFQIWVDMWNGKFPELPPKVIHKKFKRDCPKCLDERKYRTNVDGHV